MAHIYNSQLVSAVPLKLYKSILESSDHGPERLGRF